jgi:hypothetical protein
MCEYIVQNLQWQGCLHLQLGAALPFLRPEKHNNIPDRTTHVRDSRVEIRVSYVELKSTELTVIFPKSDLMNGSNDGGSFMDGFTDVLWPKQHHHQ